MLNHCPPGAPAAAPASRPAPPRDEDAWKTLLAKLASADQAVRVGAQNQLDAATRKDLPVLRRLAATISDAGIAPRLALRVAALEEEVALNPEPISLHVEDAPLSEVVDKLAQATGAKILLAPSSDSRLNYRFSLDVHDKPFWEIAGLLSRQHTLCFTSGVGDELRMYEATVGTTQAIVGMPGAE